ncbi:MAG: SDR family oxidoreductase [Flavobacteriales bacterium]|nr:SDR family oxidoreductase [Flavobacteriales bacterium]
MKTFLITGASSGIGLAIARLLHESGHRVIGTYYRNPPNENSPEIEWHPWNVLDNHEVPAFIPERLDGFVYCPGSINLKPFHRIKTEEFESDFRLQVSGAIEMLQYALPALKKSDAASVVLFSTVAVQNGFNFHTQVAASKGAIEGLTRALAAEWAPGIRVNCIAPSLTNTPLASRLLNSDDKIEANAQRHPLKRVGQPSDMAHLAEFLLTERSGWITGQILHADGGISTLKL